IGLTSVLIDIFNLQTVFLDPIDAISPQNVLPFSHVVTVGGAFTDGSHLLPGLGGDQDRIVLEIRQSAERLLRRLRRSYRRIRYSRRHVNLLRRRRRLRRRGWHVILKHIPAAYGILILLVTDQIQTNLRISRIWKSLGAGRGQSRRRRYSGRWPAVGKVGITGDHCQQRDQSQQRL